MVKFKMKYGGFFLNKIIKSLLNRLNNKGTIISLTALIVSLLLQFGVDIDSEKVIGIVQTVCSILILLGVMNNPVDNTDAFIPGVIDSAADKLEEGDK